MASLRRILALGFVFFVVIWSGIEARALPQGKVTQSGEPSHFQVDDKAAEIEVNANPAGVKVNAKPASLQVVAKPGAPAIPVYHPAIHLAPHYLPPPIIHREPAMYFHHHRPCFPYCLGMSRGWFYSGLRRNKLPKPSRKIDSGGTRRSKLSKKGGKLSRRDGIPRVLDLDEDGSVISRSHKSSIPRPHKHKNKGGNSHKRQFIAGIPQMYQPMGLGTLGGLGSLGGLGAANYGVQPYASTASTRAPLARSLISSFGGAPSTNILQSLGIYGANGLNSPLAGYRQPLANNALGSLSPQAPSNGLGIYGAMDGNGQYSNFGQRSSNYGLGQRQGNPITKFLQDEINHEMYRSAADPSTLGLGQGYSRSIINTPYTSPSYSGLESLLSGRTMGSAGGVFGSGGGLGSSGLGYNTGNPALTQLAQMYAAQLSAMQGLSPGLQQIASTRSALPWLPYPYTAVGSRSPLVGRSKVPGSKNIIGKKNNELSGGLDNQDSKKSHVENKDVPKEDYLGKKKMRKKRQALFDPDEEGLDLNDILQNALVNEVKRQMILSAPPQPEIQQLAALRDDTPQPMRIPLPGLQRFYEEAQQQTANPLLQQMPLNALGADYVAPFDNYGGRIAAAGARLSELALGRSQTPPDQMRLVPTMPQTMPVMPQNGPVARYQGPQPLTPNGPIRYVGSPMSFRADYTSPIQYEEMPSHHRRKYGRHPLFRRRLRRPHPRYDDVYDDDDENDDDYDEYNEDRGMYHADHLGKERVSLGGSYSESDIPRDEGETLVDTNNHGFGPITVEAKTAEGVRQSLGEESRSNIAKPEKPKERPQKKNSIEHHRRQPFRKGVL